MNYDVMYRGSVRNTRSYHVLTKHESATKIVVDAFGVEMQADQRPSRPKDFIFDIWTDSDGNRYCRVLRCSESSVKAKQVAQFVIPDGIDDDVAKQAFLSL